MMPGGSAITAKSPTLISPGCGGIQDGAPVAGIIGVPGSA